jgi:hypothetical protein
LAFNQTSAKIYELAYILIRHILEANQSRDLSDKDMHAMLVLWRKARNLRKLLAIALEASISRLMWLRLCVSI